MTELNPYKIGIAVICELCGKTKQPIGRSAPIGLSLCNEECKGYNEFPYPGELWTDESEQDFGYPVKDSGTKYAN